MSLSGGRELPYRARIMLGACGSAGGEGRGRGDLQPLQWLQQGSIVLMAPLEDPGDTEEAFVQGREDIVCVQTSPVKVEVLSGPPEQLEQLGDGEQSLELSAGRSSTIADFYRYQAMRAALGAVGSVQRGVQSLSRPPQSSLIGSSISGDFHGHHGHGPGQQQHHQKPPFSYTHIIFMAIESSAHRAMTVNDIYLWCEAHFPYYTQAGVGWKNSLRHNLSINKSFKKISRDGRGGPGRGAYWVVEPRERSNLIDAIRRSPCSLGHFPLLNNTYPWGSATCYSNTNSLTAIPSSSTTRCSLINNKLASPSDMLSASSRGSLLRIGGQITDASQLIRSSPIIQRLSDSSGILDLSSHSAVPLITLVEPLDCKPPPPPPPSSSSSQLHHLLHNNNNNQHHHHHNRNSNNQLGSEESLPEAAAAAVNDDSSCRGTVVVVDESGDCCGGDAGLEYDQLVGDIVRALNESDLADRLSDSGRTESIKLPLSRDPCRQYDRVSQEGGGMEDILLAEDDAFLTREVIKKHCSIKQNRICSCDKDDGTDAEDSASSPSIADYSERSETDFNWRKSVGRKKELKQKNSAFFKKLKLFTKHRKVNSRSRVNNIIRAPHSDHVYALLQEYLPPANVEQVYSNMLNIEDTDIYSSHFEDNSLSHDLSLIPLSKRSKHKLHIKKASSSQAVYSDSDTQTCPIHANGVKDSKKHSQSSVALKTRKRKSNKSILTPKLCEQYTNVKKELSGGSRPMQNYDDDEERENRYFDDTDNINRKRRLVKYESVENCYQDSESNNFYHRQSQIAKDSSAVKRKVGRPKKSDQGSTISRQSSEHFVHKENKFKRTSKILKHELKYLKESNSNKKMDSTVCNKEERVAIDILVDLQRKSKQQRINNMYNLSNFIERNNSDSNLS